MEAVESDSQGRNQCSTRRIDQNNTLWIPVQSLNPHLICGLCQGYLYEACTITECMHSFCKSCIVKHLQKSLNCPMCAILIHPTDPFVHIRHDGLLQDIVYALLPQVEKEDLEKERLFYKKLGREIGFPATKKGKPGVLAHTLPDYSVTSSTAASQSSLIPQVSLCLQYLDPIDVPRELDKQYVRVTGGATVRSVSSFLKRKLHIEDSHKVDLYCPCRSGFVCLSNSHTLKAVKDLYCYDKDLLLLKFDISEQ